MSRHLPDLRRRRRDQVRGDDRDRVRAAAARDRGQAPKRDEAFLIRMNPRVSSQFTGDGARVLRQLEAETSKLFYFEGTEGLPLDHFEVTLRGLGDEVAERAVPFAAATRCSSASSSRTCTTSTTRSRRSTATSSRSPAAARSSAAKVLVRIDEAGAQRRARPHRRSAGTRTSAADGRGEARWRRRAVESKPRRRGRRGGRRRSAATAEQDPTRRLDGERVSMYAIVKTGGKQYRVEKGDAARRAAARRRGRDRRARAVLVRSDDTASATGWARQRSRPRCSATSAARSCACSSSSPSAATRSRPATARS